MIEAIKVMRLDARPSRYETDESRVNLDTRFDMQPASLDRAYDVIVRYSGQEKRSGLISLAAGTQTEYHAGEEEPEEWGGCKVDMILCPSLDAAVRTIDCFDIWEKQAVFENVTIETAE